MLTDKLLTPRLPSAILPVSPPATYPSQELQMITPSHRRLCFLAIFIFAILASIQLGAEPPKAANAFKGDAAPPGWQPASPRDEIRPRFSFDAKGGPKGEGSLLITADEREGLHGWWQKSFPVTGGRYYRFQTLRKIYDVKQPRRSAVVRILWQDDQGKSV